MFLNGSTHSRFRLSGKVVDRVKLSKFITACMLKCTKCVDYLAQSCIKYVSKWQKLLDDDIALAEAAWEEGEFDELELDFGKRKTITIDLVLKAMDRDCIEWRHNCDKWTAKDAWLSQLDWTPRCLSTGKNKNLPKWAGFITNLDK